MDTKTEFNLNNIRATLSLISISSVKKLAGKCPQTWSQLRSMNAKAGEHCHSELCGLDVTISALRLVRWKTIDLFALRHWNLRNLTLQQECYLTSTRAFFRTFARLYNAAASPASRLRSAGSLATMCFYSMMFHMDFNTGLFRRPTKRWSTHQLNSIYTVASLGFIYISSMIV